MSVVDGQTRRKWKRGFRRQKRSAAATYHQADQQIEKFLIRRFDRLVSVRKFVFLWIGLFGILFFSIAVQLRALSPYYQSLSPVPGGIYSEGIIGAFSNANPLYVTSAPDAAISHLVFSGLFKYDKNNKLVGDLAKDWSVNTNQTIYIVHLNHNIKWQDGASFTADDVVFTYRTIQNIEAQSPLYTSWQGITVKKIDPYTVTFELPNQLTAFPQSLTNGIVPQHLLGNIRPPQLRSAEFNTSPVGTGPFEWKFVEITGKDTTDRQQRISLASFNRYEGGQPKLDGFNLITFSDDDHLLGAFNKKQVNAMSGLDSIPDYLTSDKNVHIYRTPLTSSVMAFFNNSNPILANADVRRALVSGVDRSKVQNTLGYPVTLSDSPFLKGQLGYNPAITELAYSQDSAGQLLDKAGWTVGDNTEQRLDKSGKPLHITMASQDTHEYAQIAQLLQKEWGKLGIKIDVNYYSNSDLQDSVISNHDYDVLLYGINIGADPDVFAYWHSSQSAVTSQGHLNLSEYKSQDADQALEAGRTRSDPILRSIKYKSFLTDWVNDAPALALYQPAVTYVSRGPVFNFQRSSTNTSSDRFYNVNQWMVRQKHQTL
jgi:peptide/nickel transport system substrate-binding protein